MLGEEELCKLTAGQLNEISVLVTVIEEAAGHLALSVFCREPYKDRVDAICAAQGEMDSAFGFDLRSEVFDERNHCPCQYEANAKHPRQTRFLPPRGMAL